MNQQFQEILDAVERRRSEAHQKVANAQSELSEGQRELAAADQAAQRIELLRSGLRQLPVEICIECFVFHNREIKMAPQNSDDGDIDIFRCRECGTKIEIEN